MTLEIDFLNVFELDLQFSNLFNFLNGQNDFKNDLYKNSFKRKDFS